MFITFYKAIVIVLTQNKQTYVYLFLLYIKSVEGREEAMELLRLLG